MSTMRTGLAVLIGAMIALAPGAAASAQEIGSIDASPDSGPIGTEFTMTGDISCPDHIEGDQVSVSFVDLTAGPQTVAPLGSVVTADDGTFPLDATVPAELLALMPGVGTEVVPVATGVYGLRASCGRSATSSVNLARGTFTVTASPTPEPTTPVPTEEPTTVEPTEEPTTVEPTEGPTTAAPTEEPTARFVPPPVPPADADPIVGDVPARVPAGGHFTLTESGFVAGEEVNVVLYSDPVVLATVTADAQGTATATVRIPETTAPGDHTLVLFAESAVKSAALTVVAAQPPTPQPTPTATTPAQAAPTSAPATLAHTGPGDGSPHLAVAAGALVLLGGMLIARRRVALVG